MGSGRPHARDELLSAWKRPSPAGVEAAEGIVQLSAARAEYASRSLDGLKILGVVVWDQ